MSHARMMNRLQAGNPVPVERVAREAGAPWTAALRERLLATDVDSEERPQRRRPWPVVAAAALVLAGAGTVAANEFQAAVAPNTPEGARLVRDTLQSLRGTAPASPGDEPSNVAPDPETARVVFSATTRRGEYTIWLARTDGPRGRALLFSSPRNGIGGSFGVSGRLPHAPYVVVDGGLGREVYGRVSTGITRIRVELGNGRHEWAMVANGWFVVGRDSGHAKPVRLVGLDRHGRVVTSTTKGLF